MRANSPNLNGFRGISSLATLTPVSPRQIASLERKDIMTSNIRRPQPGDRVRRLAGIHGTTIARFTVSRVAFKPEGDYRHILGLEYGHDVSGNLCFHSAIAALNDDLQDMHGNVVGYEAVEGGVT
jgi:hypothetical protein